MRNDAEGAGPRTAASAGLIDKLEADRVDALVAMGQALRTIELADRDRAAAERDYERARERCDEAMQRLALLQGNGTPANPTTAGDGEIKGCVR